MQRKRKADANFYSTVAVVPRKDLPFEYEAPSETRPVRNVSESTVGNIPRDTPAVQVREQGDRLPIDHEQIRRRQSAVYGQGPDAPTLFSSPYRQDPRRLTGSSGFRELFHTPLNVGSGTTSAMPEPTRVSERTYGVSGGGAPPPGGEPPDDNGSDGPPHSPSPHVPRSQLPHHPGRGNPPPGMPGGTGPPDGGDGGGGYDHNPDRGDDRHNSGRGIETSTNQNRLEAYFDNKLRTDLVPEWDGNPDTLSHWITKINHLAQRSSTVYTQLGQIIPLRLRRNAEKWFFSLPVSNRMEASKNWDTIRETICAYYMNRAWLDRQKLRATKAYFREPGCTNETPSEYYVRKSELLLMITPLSDSELILEIMNGAPAFWHTIIDAHRCASAVEFQTAIKYHEESLLHAPFTSGDGMERRIRNLENALQSKPRFDSSKSFRDARARLVGWSSKQAPPKFPRDDSNVSKKPTPESKGARPCRHCGSGKHWDNECKHARSASRSAHTRYTALAEESDADLAYEDLYLEALHESDEESDPDNAHANNVASATDTEPEEPVSDQQDSGPEAEVHCQLAKPAMSLFESMSRLGGLQPKESNSTSPGWPGMFTPRNRKERRKLMKDSKLNGSLLRSSKLTSWAPNSLIKLRRLMSRPAGCAFLGSSATTSNVWLGDYGKNPTTLVADSGSDITLISQKALSSMEDPPKIKTGQKINLIQVTGTSKISGYVNLPIFFDSDTGPVQIEVEAYVVKGMTTPVILGNDFADQYSISLIREGSDSFLMFGNTGRKSKTESSVNSPLRDEEGHAFKIRVLPDLSSSRAKFKAHRRMKKSRKQIRMHNADANVRAIYPVTIPPESASLIPVSILFPGDKPDVYVEKILHSNRGPEDFYGITDALVSRDNPKLHVNNFSSQPVTIHQGQLLGHARSPSNWLDRKSNISQEQLERCQSHAQIIRAIAEQNFGVDDVPIDPSPERDGEVVQGGPKTQEIPPENIPEKQLLEEVDTSPELNDSNKKALQKVVLTHKNAFGLDGRLGNYDAKVEINLRPGVKEISLPPYNASPAKREVIDKQMDSWLSLGVIEPSKSPWGFPALIAYRGGKPRMCIDYRKLNEVSVPDEFPLPRQDNILQALTGSRWLSTLDALAGFTQLQMSPDAKEKTAFRTHRGLYQFKRMPFGYRNGPAVFQRVMQSVLAPFLWIFALVYIDDIVIYSKTFNEHLNHLDKVFGAIEKSGITLSPAKCHLAYQSLKLLGQKVSRLGLSTHKEKVDAIRELSAPKNVHELQMFLGMMVYFSSYIPFYAWIVAPLFELLKKSSAWEWGNSQQEAFNLAKTALTSAPVRAHAIPGLGYRVYSDACDVGIAAILQQIQPIKIRDLKGTKGYEKLKSAHEKGLPIPQMVIPISKDEELPHPGTWDKDFENTMVHVERVIAYWSRTLKSAERNYSPTEREALALRDGLIKFQPYIEGEKIEAITDHAALIWSRTFQNVNRRLLTWGTVFAAYPDLKIVHRAGRVHSNVDPISRLRRNIPYQDGPSADDSIATVLDSEMDPLENLYSEISPQFEARTLQLMADYEEENLKVMTKVHSTSVDISNDYQEEITIPYVTAKTFNLVSSLSKEEIQIFVDAYAKDPYFKRIRSELRQEPNWISPKHPLFMENEEGLLYFEDWNGNYRLCVPKDEQPKLLSEVHDEITEGAHAGYHKTYNKLASTFYWPRMSRDVKKFVISCDICQKAKPRKHAPIGLLQPLPIPEKPFEVVTMDFITELPDSLGYDAILVIVDKLTKYAIFIPTNGTVNEEGTAKLFFEHVLSKFGIPRQIVSDRDPRWTSTFWKELCRLLNTKRSLTTAYHPQADGQTEVMNQTLETALRAYVSPNRNDWTSLLASFALSYNNLPHSSTGFTPAFLLFGFHPNTSSSYLNPSLDAVTRPETTDHAAELDARPSKPSTRAPIASTELVESETAKKFLLEFETYRAQARQALQFAQAAQKRDYDRGRSRVEFEEGDRVLINPHSLNRLRAEKGKGRKLFMKYEGPFEILQKLGPVTYRLRMPASYGLHPVLNVTHLESYTTSDPAFGSRPSKRISRDDFETLPEYEVESIVAERWRRVRNGRRIQELLTHFVGYDSDYDEWLTRRQLKNAPDMLREWDRRDRGSSRL